MKVLVDSCAGRALAAILESNGHEVDFVGDRDHDPGDDRILERGFQQERVVITRDKDFGTLAVLQQREHFGIVRLVALAKVQEAETCLRVLSKYQSELKNGALITVEPHRIRVRREN